MKKLTLAAMLLASFNVAAFTMPSAPSSPTGYDEIRTQDGTVCRSSVGGNLQMYGGMSDASGNSNGNYYGRGSEDEQAAFVGFAYSFGGEKRMRCDRIAEIETQRAEIELNKLKSEIEALKKIRELEMLEASGNLPKLSRVNN